MEAPGLNKIDVVRKYKLGTCYKTYRYLGGKVVVDKVFRYVKYEKANQKPEM